jgi:hypothetical protein
VYQKKQEESRNTQQTSSPYTFCVSPVNDQGTVFRLPLQKTEESNHHHFNFSKYSHVHYASSSSYYEPCIIFLESPETSTNDLKGHFVANVPFFLLAHHPGNFFLNVSMTVEFNNSTQKNSFSSPPTFTTHTFSKSSSFLAIFETHYFSIYCHV